MASIGGKLRLARLGQNLEIADLAAQTKIGKRYLEAIESDDRQSLPGAFFYKNWVQQYAKSLSLDVAAFASEVDGILANDKEPALPGQEDKSLPKEMRPAPLEVGGSRGGGHRIVYSVAMLVVVVVACSGFYTLWRNEQVIVDVAENNAEAKPAIEKSIEKPVTAKPVDPPQVEASTPDTRIAYPVLHTARNRTKRKPVPQAAKSR